MDPCIRPSVGSSSGGLALRRVALRRIHTSHAQAQSSPRAPPPFLPWSRRPGPACRPPGAVPCHRGGPPPPPSARRRACGSASAAPAPGRPWAGGAAPLLPLATTMDGVPWFWAAAGAAAAWPPDLLRHSWLFLLRPADYSLRSSLSSPRARAAPLVADDDEDSSVADEPGGLFGAGMGRRGQAERVSQRAERVGWQSKATMCSWRRQGILGRLSNSNKAAGSRQAINEMEGIQAKNVFRRPRARSNSGGGGGGKSPCQALATHTPSIDAGRYARPGCD